MFSASLDHEQEALDLVIASKLDSFVKLELMAYKAQCHARQLQLRRVESRTRHRTDSAFSAAGGWSMGSGPCSPAAAAAGGGEGAVVGMTALVSSRKSASSESSILSASSVTTSSSADAFFVDDMSNGAVAVPPTPNAAYREASLREFAEVLGKYMAVAKRLGPREAVLAPHLDFSVMKVGGD